MLKNPKCAIYGEIAKTYFKKGVGTLVVDIDRSALLSRLLFFDEVVIRSVRLREIPFLVKLFGLRGFQALLDEGILKISCEMTTTLLDRHIDGQRALPIKHFSQGIVDVPDHPKYLEECSRSLLQIAGLSNRARLDLYELICKRISRPQSDYHSELLKQLRLDLTRNQALISTLIARVNPGLGLHENDVTVTVHEPEEGVQVFETNLMVLRGLTPLEEHVLLTKMISAAANLNQRMLDMQAYSAISLFADNEAPILFRRLSGITSPLNPTYEESSFLRVLSFTGLPDLIASGRVDVHTLLQVRESAACATFRHWLRNVREINDEELESMLSGLAAQLSSFTSSRAGKVLRFMTNAALGFIPHYGTVASLVEGAADTFLLEKLLPTPGILSFLNKDIPSIFDKADS